MRQFDGDSRKWEKDMLDMAFTMKRDEVTYPCPFGAPPIPQPEFGSKRRFLEAAPTHLSLIHI